VWSTSCAFNSLIDHALVCGCGSLKHWLSIYCGVLLIDASKVDGNSHGLAEVKSRGRLLPQRGYSTIL
jgi:hypothetical protein